MTPDGTPIELSPVPRPSRHSTNVLQRLLRVGRAGLVSIHDALFPRAALDRLARRAVYCHIEQLAAGRRVLDLDSGWKHGGNYLRAMGAVEVVAGRPPADDADPFELAVAFIPGNLETAFEETLVRLAPGGQLVVATPPDLAEEWRGRLEQEFLRVEMLSLLASFASADPRDVWITAAEPSKAAPDEPHFQLLTASAPLRQLPEGPRRLHVGAGEQLLDGWINIDIRRFKGIDLVADVTDGLDITDVDAVFAEHFLEHLAIDHALDFLSAVQRMLVAGGRLRLSLPNLDWVWKTHYRLKVSPEDKVTAALALNAAFYGWEHQFVWNRETLELALTATGFRDLTWHGHGESDVEHLRGLERHETYADDGDLQHVLIVEACKGTPDPQKLKAFRKRLKREFITYVEGY